MERELSGVKKIFFNQKREHRKRLFQVLVMAIVSIGLLSGCNGFGSQSDKSATSTDDTAQTTDDNSYTTEVFAMDTYMTLTAYGEKAEEAVEAAVEEIDRIEQLVSTGIETSEVSFINQNGAGQVSEDTMYLIERSLELYKDTDGAFDITIYPIMKEWGFTTGDYQVPDDSKLEELLTLVDADKISIDEESETVTLENEGAQIDLGGIAKGYTSSRIMEIFKEYGIENAVVSLGGNVQVLGTKTSGENWNVGIENPEDTSDYIGVLNVSDKAVITSGGYERYFEEDGEKYHHIIDPSTGKPASSGLISVTIVSSDGTLADGLSTSLFIMGEEKAIEYWKENQDAFDFIMETEDGELIVSEGIRESFSSDLEIKIVEG